MKASPQRNCQKFYHPNLSDFTTKAFIWASGFSHAAYFCPNDHNYLYGPFNHFMAIDVISTIPSANNNNSFKDIQDFHDHTQDWLIGNFTYDLKNEIETLESLHPDLIGFDPFSFFQPKHLLFLSTNYVEIQSVEDPALIFNAIDKMAVSNIDHNLRLTTEIKQSVSKDKYLENVKRIQQEIIKGEVYELNYCMEFSGHNLSFNPYHAFRKLNTLSPMPFGTFQKFNNKYLICASPERFLKKIGRKIISQPIKGTIGRGKNEGEDDALKKQLQSSEKERAENMMIVDLVRNDLAKSGIPGSIKVEEIFGIYSYKNIHQMVSTITAISKEDAVFSEIIKNAFPMGSMTGAPKVSAMKLIEEIEVTKRGLFSGAAGYITPDGDFDFNVVIRSIFFDKSSGNLSFQVGSAITYDSIPEKEYEEVLLKAEAIFNILNG